MCRVSLHRFQDVFADVLPPVSAPAVTRLVTPTKEYPKFFWAAFRVGWSESGRLTQTTVMANRQE